MSDDRPDPITPRVTMWATLGTVAAGLISAAVDIGWKQPAGNHVMDWVYSLLPVVLAYVAVRKGAALAKEHTTPLESPQDEDGNELVAVGRHEARPEDGSGFLDDWDDDTDPPPRPPITT
jgi:hypothetical protein